MATLCTFPLLTYRGLTFWMSKHGGTLPYLMPYVLHTKILISMPPCTKADAEWAPRTASCLPCVCVASYQGKFQLRGPGLRLHFPRMMSTYGATQSCAACQKRPCTVNISWTNGAKWRRSNKQLTALEWGQWDFCHQPPAADPRLPTDHPEQQIAKKLIKPTVHRAPAASDIHITT